MRKPMKPTTVQTRPNTVGLKQDALADLLNQIDRDAAKNPCVSREFVRWGFRREAIEVVLHQPGGGNPVTLRLACRNISCGGLSALHSAFAHLGTRVLVKLTKPDGQPLPIEGTIVRCTHLRGLIHELGIKFDHKVAARDLVHMDPFGNTFSLEKVDPERLKGTVVYADDSAAERRLVTHYLRGTSLRLRTASDAGEAFKLCEEGCDLIISDMDMPGMNGAQFVQKIRDAGHDTPVILVTADPGTIKRSALTALRVGAFLAKPFRQEILLRAIAEFMTVDSSSRQNTSSLPSDHPNRGLVEGYIENLREFAKRLAACLDKRDADAARSVAYQILGSAPNYGYEAIAKLAQTAASGLASAKDFADAVPALRAVQAACERARA
jgi:CheY-like chemotaxis protein